MTEEDVQVLVLAQLNGKLCLLDYGEPPPGYRKPIWKVVVYILQEHREIEAMTDSDDEAVKWLRYGVVDWHALGGWFEPFWDFKPFWNGRANG